MRYFIQVSGPQTSNRFHTVAERETRKAADRQFKVWVDTLGPDHDVRLYYHLPNQTPTLMVEHLYTR
jgi:hypothetical protein